VGELDEIIGCSQRGQSHQSHQYDRQIMIAQISEKDRRAEQPGDEKQSPHRGRPLLVLVQLA
jgi:hypothetical protein